jgi:uncharacterized protein YkwD
MAARRTRLALVLGLLLALAPLLLPAAARPSRTRVTVSLASTMLTDLNQIRIEHGLVRLAVSPGLTAAADAHAHDMLAHGYFAHTSPNGLAFWQLIERYYPEANHRFWAVGQNLLWASGQIDAPTALTTWMNSPPHRANLLKPDWRQIGIAAVSAPKAPGVYGRRSVTVIAADFGVRR